MGQEFWSMTMPNGKGRGAMMCAYNTMLCIESKTNLNVKYHE